MDMETSSRRNVGSTSRNDPLTSRPLDSDLRCERVRTRTSAEASAVDTHRVARAADRAEVLMVSEECARACRCKL